jgi:hypothetical protein
MAALSSFASNTLIDALIRGGPLVMPPTWYVALVTTAGATNALAGVEVTGGSYARVAIPATLASFSGTQGDGTTSVSIGLSAQSSNNIAISFATPTTNWGAVVGYEFWDAKLFGTRWVFDTLTVPKTISVGDTVEFPPGTLTFDFI